MIILLLLLLIPVVRKRKYEFAKLNLYLPEVAESCFAHFIASTASYLIIIDWSEYLGLHF